MKIEYHDVVFKQKIVVQVKAKVAHFMQKDDKENEDREKEQKENEKHSLDDLLDRGFQPVFEWPIEKQIEKRQMEEQYLNSHQYKQFCRDLENELLKYWDKMSPMVRKCLYLRIFKGLSWGKVAQILKISRGAAQEFVRRGFKYVKYFLDKDIAEQDKIEKTKHMKRAQAKIDD